MTVTVNLTTFWEVWVLLLPGKLRGLSSYVDCNVEIPRKQDLEITDGRKVCRKVGKKLVSAEEFCEEKNNNHSLCALSHPRVREDELHCKSVSRYLNYSKSVRARD